VDTTALLEFLVPVVTVVVAAGTSLLGFVRASDRFDFAAHYLGGLGGMMILLSLLSFRRSGPPRGWSVLLLVIIALGLGVCGEWLVFTEGGFDLVDVANQSLGAITAGMIFTLWPLRGVRVTLVWLALGLMFVAGGLRLVGYV